MDWLGYATTTFHHAASTIPIPFKKSASGSDSTSLLDFCTSVTPPCRLTPLLFNGHLQTIYTAITTRAVPVYYRRHVFTSDDTTYPGIFAVDFVTNDIEHVQSTRSEEDKQLHPGISTYSEDEWDQVCRGSDDTKPMLVVLHGLSGGSHETYLREVLAPLVNESVQIGETPTWEACVVNARGCARSNVVSPVLFNARATWDVRQVVRWLRKTYPNRPLFGIGFSLGGNILVNYLGEEGDKCPLSAAVVCSNPWNLEVGSIGLQRTWMGLNVYSKSMGANMKKLFERHIDQISKNEGIDIEKVRKTRYLHEFDREVQCPTWGWPTEGAYYRDASSTEPLLSVKIPLFAINAEDDPVACKEACPFVEVTRNPYTVLCTTTLGGHLSWFEIGGSRWYVKPVISFLNKMATEVDLKHLKPPTATANGERPSSKPNKPTFDPVRRKLYIASQ